MKKSCVSKPGVGVCIKARASQSEIFRDRTKLAIVWLPEKPD